MKRLELCEVVEPKGEMVHQCETFPITFDSGAECSLIKQKYKYKYFTCLDMASGYYQIPFHADSVECTAFVTPDGQYEKFSFLKSTVQYLGYEVSADEIRPNSLKIAALTALSPPQSVSALRQFIGLASYFRQFQRFSCFMKPIYLLTSQRNEFIWNAEHEQIRQRIISILTQKPVLVIFDPRHPIELHTDASSRRCGAILLHKINNRPHVVEYLSKAASLVESRYHSYELETLAVV